MASDVVNERTAQNPHYIDQLDPSGWELLLNDTRTHFRQRQSTGAAETEAFVGTGYELTRLQKEVEQLQNTNQQLRNHLKERDRQATAADTVDTEEEVELFPHQILLPPLPSTPPPAYRDIISQQSWPRRSQFLALLAISGWSLQKSLKVELARMNGISPGAGSIKRLVKRLTDDKIIVKHTIKTDAGTAVLIQLSELGQNIVTAMRIRRIESEWERLLRMRGAEQRIHSALICQFAAHARKLGYLTQVSPDLPGEGQADLQLIDAQGHTTLVFIESDSQISTERLAAWQAVAQSQGHIAFCATTAEARQALLSAAFSAGLAGRATDFERLRRVDVKTLWAEQWPAGPAEENDGERTASDDWPSLR